MRSAKIMIAAFFLAVPGPALAQQVPREMAAAATARSDDDRGNPRLELLGLLGLIGLLGRIRREPNIHVDARRAGRKVSADSNARS